MITSIVKVLLTFSVLSAKCEDNKFLKLFNDDERILYFGDETPEFEIVYLPNDLSYGRQSITTNEQEKFLTFEAFNEDIEIILNPNSNLISPYTNVVKIVDDKRVNIKRNNSALLCHFLSSNKSKSSAAVSNCNEDEISGLIFHRHLTLEIIPLPERLQNLYRVKTSESKNGKFISKIPHIVKKAQFNESFGDDEYFSNKIMKISNEKFLKEENYQNYTPPNVEIGLFFDEEFYRIYSSFFQDDNERMLNFILAYMNGVQSLFHHKSLTRKIDFTISHLEIMESQPLELPHHYGERNGLIESFCKYQKTLNPRDDHHPQHWDMSAYISGLDFFAWDRNGSKNRGTMGFATVGGVCNFDQNCVIAEFGVVNQHGNPYPSTGFASIFILAHEIAHNLGMSHDSEGNSCGREGYLMSPTRGFEGETTWSECSARVVQAIEWAECLFDKTSTLSSDELRLSEYPGLKFSTKKQCEILTKDENAYPFTNGALSSICHNLHCRTTRKPGLFYAGPALQGTQCGKDKWCDGGSCVNKKSTPEPLDEIEYCKSSCLTGGKGVEGIKNSKIFYFGNKKICDDEKVCKSRRSVIAYGTEKCQEFSKFVDDVDPNGFGLQGSFSSVRVWMSCAIYCKKQNSSSYFSPRVELNEFGLNPYFPDGTLCHRNGEINYYCINAHCLPHEELK